MAELTERIIGAFCGMHNELGYGFLGSVYEASLMVALRQLGLSVEHPQFGRLLFDYERKKIRGNPCKSAAGVAA